MTLRRHFGGIAAALLALAAMGAGVIVGVRTYAHTEAAVVAAAMGRMGADTTHYADAIVGLANRGQEQLLAATKSEVMVTAISYGANPSQMTYVARDLQVVMLRNEPFLDWSLIGPSTGHGTGGLELARVRRSVEDGRPRIASAADLGARPNDPSVLAAYAIRVGTTHGSVAMAADQLGGFPVLRLSTGVPELIGDLAPATMFGIFVLDLDLRPVLAAMSASDPPALLVNELGEYVSGGKRLNLDLPRLAGGLRFSDTMSARLPTTAGEVAVAGAVARLPGGQRLIVVERQPVAGLVDGRGLARNAVTASVATALLAGSGAVVAFTLFGEARRRRVKTDN